jgi:hypothetical protein
MKTHILKDEVKLQRLKNSLSFEKRQFDLNFNQKIDYVNYDKDKSKYGMKLVNYQSDLVLRPHRYD